MQMRVKHILLNFSYCMNVHIIITFYTHTILNKKFIWMNWYPSDIISNSLMIVKRKVNFYYGDVSGVFVGPQLISRDLLHVDYNFERLSHT